MARLGRDYEDDPIPWGDYVVFSDEGKRLRKFPDNDDGRAQAEAYYHEVQQLDNQKKIITQNQEIIEANKRSPIYRTPAPYIEPEYLEWKRVKEKRLAQEQVEKKKIRKVRRAIIPAGYVDLGLPSGTLWKATNESGFFTYSEAKKLFGEKLPSKSQWEELKNSCRWEWTEGSYKVIGKGGRYIFLPAAGWRYSDGSVSGVGSTGRYWSSTPNGPLYAWILYFNSSEVRLYDHVRSLGRSVRIVID